MHGFVLALPWPWCVLMLLVCRHAIEVYPLYHALGLQTECMIILLALVTKAAESHVFALWPEAKGLPFCKAIYVVVQCSLKFAGLAGRDFE